MCVVGERTDGDGGDVPGVDDAVTAVSTPRTTPDVRIWSAHPRALLASVSERSTVRGSPDASMRRSMSACSLKIGSACSSGPPNADRGHVDEAPGVSTDRPKDPWCRVGG